MKIKVKALKERIKGAKREIISSIETNDVFGNNQEMKLIEMLLTEVSDATELDSFIHENVDDFVTNKMSVEDIFLARNSYEMSDAISEILSEIENTLSEASVSAMDRIFEDAAYRYMLRIGSSIEKELLQMYLLDNVRYLLLNVDDDMELDASEYGTYNDEESLLDEFIDELISTVSGSERIIQIEDNPKDILFDFFQLEV